MRRKQPRAEAGSGGPPSGSRGRRLRPHQVRQFGAGALAALIIVFAVLNLDRVRVNWIVVTSQTPLIVVIAVGFVIGALVGLLLGRSRLAGR